MSLSTRCARIALAATRLADASCGTIRLNLLKIGAQVRISVRRIKFSMASAFPCTDVFRTARAALNSAALTLGPQERCRTYDHERLQPTAAAGDKPCPNDGTLVVALLKSTAAALNQPV
jgi:hypothetical protein